MSGTDDPGERQQAGKLATHLFEQRALSLRIKRIVEGALTDGSVLTAAGNLLGHVRG